MFFYRIKKLLLGYILNLLSYMGDFMAEVVKIVLTGGPCGGKTSALKYISEELKKLNIPTITIGEVASRLFSEGKTPENVGSYEFHRELFEIQLAEENEKTQIAKNMDCEKAVLLFDRGLLDSRAYITPPGEKPPFRSTIRHMPARAAAHPHSLAGAGFSP